MDSAPVDGRSGDEGVRGLNLEKLIVDNLEHYAVFVVNETGTIISWNPGVRTLFGYEELEFIGHDSRMLFGDDDIADGLIDRERVVARGGGSVSLRRWHKRRDGSLVWGDGQLVALFDGERFVGFAFVVRDDSTRMRLEAELVAAARLKDRFLATVSHELRTPLMAILGWIRVMQDGGLTRDETYAAVATIERNALIQRRLVEDLLDCARIAVGSLSIAPVPTDLRSLVAQQVESMRAIASEKNINLDVAIAHDSIVVSADPERMRQIIDNLLSNAIKFTLDSGTITVGLDRDGSSARITVTDTGVGIKPEFLPFLFERFRQAATSGPLSQAGIGIGLSIVRELVEMHSGTITAASEGIGKGAVFVVRIPM